MERPNGDVISRVPVGRDIKTADREDIKISKSLIRQIFQQRLGNMIFLPFITIYNI